MLDKISKIKELKNSNKRRNQRNRDMFFSLIMKVESELNSFFNIEIMNFFNNHHISCKLDDIDLTIDEKTGIQLVLLGKNSLADFYNNEAHSERIAEVYFQYNSSLKKRSFDYMLVGVADRVGHNRANEVDSALFNFLTEHKDRFLKFVEQKMLQLNKEYLSRYSDTYPNSREMATLRGSLGNDFAMWLEKVPLTFKKPIDLPDYIGRNNNYSLGCPVKIWIETCPESTKNKVYKVKFELSNGNQRSSTFAKPVFKSFLITLLGNPSVIDYLKIAHNKDSLSKKISNL